MTILGLAGVLVCQTSRHRQNGLSYVPKKILTWMLREARGGLKVQMKCFFIAEFERAAKIRKIATYGFLISVLVQEL